MIARYANREETATSSRGNVFNQFPIERPLKTEEAGIIRAYRPEDRAAIRRICCETGFLGNPIDSVFADRELFADLFTRAYLEYEPERAMVAEADGRVIGYLLGSVRRDFDLLLLRSGFRTATKMVFGLLTGHYAHHPRSRRFVRWLLLRGMKEQPRHPANSAHLHWDIDQCYRGRQVARRLWDIYREKLTAGGVKQCYGAFLSYRRRRPELAYARYGFAVFDRKRTTIFEPEISDPVEVVCVRKNL